MANTESNTDARMAITTNQFYKRKTAVPMICLEGHTELARESLFHGSPTIYRFTEKAMERQPASRPIGPGASLPLASGQNT